MKVDLTKQIALRNQKYEFLENKYNELQQSSKARVIDLEKQFDTLRQDQSTRFIDQDR